VGACSAKCARTPAQTLSPPEVLRYRSSPHNSTNCRNCVRIGLAKHTRKRESESRLVPMLKEHAGLRFLKAASKFCRSAMEWVTTATGATCDDCNPVQTAFTTAQHLPSARARLPLVSPCLVLLCNQDPCIGLSAAEEGAVFLCYCFVFSTQITVLASASSFGRCRCTKLLPGSRSRESRW
jgi:hypothetical protein